MGRWMRLMVGVLAGCVAALAVIAVLFATMRASWPAYVQAEPDKACTLGMMLARLSIGALGAVGAGVVATLVARDGGRAAWTLGTIFLLLSLRPHLVTLWDDYPVWYHVVYLGYLVPLTGLPGRFIGRHREQPAPALGPQDATA